MIEIPWWAKSPSPYTLVIWALFAVYVMLQIIKKKYNGELTFKEFMTHAPKLKIFVLFIDGLFLTGFVVGVFDILWASSQWLVFGHLYPGEWMISLTSIGRNLLIMFFMMIWTERYGSYWSKKFFDFHNKKFYLMIWTNALFMALWFYFGIIEGMWVTDWTYAIKYDYGLEKIACAFTLSHILWKAIQFLTIASIIKKVEK